MSSVGLDQGFKAVVGKQALVGVGDIFRTQLGKHDARLRGGRLHARAARVRGEHYRAAGLLAFGLRANLFNFICRRLAVFRKCLLVASDVAARAQHAQVVVERGHFEVGNGDVRRSERVGELGLRNAAAATELDPVRITKSGFSATIDSALSEREIADFLCVRSDAVIGERVVGSAYQRAAGQLPDVREAAHAGNHAVVRSDGYLAARSSVNV